MNGLILHPLQSTSRQTFLSGPTSLSPFLGSHCRNTVINGDRQRRSQSTNATSNTLDLAYEVHHTKEGVEPAGGPLIVLHGLFGSKQNWRSLSKSLAHRISRPVYALDLRNHGESPHSADKVHTYETMAGDVRRLVESNGWEGVSVLGHSMGGKVAMTLALSASSSSSNQKLPIKDLIVADIAPTRGSISSEFKAYLRTMERIENGDRGRMVASRKEADEVMRGVGGVEDPSIRAFLLTNLLPITSENPHARFRVPLDVIEASLEDLGDFPFDPPSTSRKGNEAEAEGEKVRSWNGPTLMIKGTKSRYINDRNIQVAKAFFPNMRLEELDAGHWVHAERPKEFIDLITEFLTEGI